MLNGLRPSCPYAVAVARWTIQLAVILAAFVLGTVVAELFGAASLGIALSFGQIAFTLTLGFVLLKA